MLRLALVVAGALTLGTVTPRPTAEQRPNPVASQLKVTVLSTMLAGNPEKGMGEWGFAALVEVDGHRLLIDTGARPETVLHNAKELGIDLSSITDVVLTHNHDDHVGGLVALRRALVPLNPSALARAHVAKGIFQSRSGPDGREANGLLPLKADYQSSGGSFVEHDGPVALFPGVWFTGPVPRPFAERNWSPGTRLKTATGAVEDSIPEDASLVINTADGMVVIAGCGHAGIINTAEYAKTFVGTDRLHAVVGGLHLFAATDQQLEWSAQQLRDRGLKYLLGAHCTGIEAVYRLRAVVGMKRGEAVIGAVGSSFTLGAGIDPLALAG